MALKGPDIEVLGITHDHHDGTARAMADAFNANPMQNCNNTARARVRPMHNNNTIKGWLVEIERRPAEQGGTPWPEEGE